MARETSVVTPERFQQGFSYSAYIDQIKVNKARFEDFYKFQVKPEDAAALKELVSRPNGPAKMLVLGEDWCGDVIRGMPMLALKPDLDLDEALLYGDTVPIIVYPDGRVEIGFEGHHG